MNVVPLPPPGRREAAQAVLAAKRDKDLRWPQLAEALDRSVVWTTAALLGQHPLTAEQARTVGSLLGLEEAIIEALQLPPVRGAAVVDTSEPVVYRLQEVVQVYGSTLAELIREEFGDGIMSAINFRVDFSRRPDPEGDRVVITFDGKFLDYRW